MSTRDMTINQIKATNKQFGANHTVKISGFKDGKGGRKPGSKNKMPDWFKTFLDQQFNPFVKQQMEFNQSMIIFKDYVLNEFQKHGWTK